MTLHRPAPGLDELARHLRGRMVVPGDPDWDTARLPWNRRVDQRPVAVVVAESAGDMAATAAFAARSGLRVTAQSSGHGAGDTLEDTIVLRTGALREIAIDPDRGRVRVGAGVRCDDLMAAISPHGLAASVGSARDAGVVGYAMFGGVGVLGRALGFMAHQVLAADVVTADGIRLRCDATSHPDLLWALRGGGGGFALVAGLELALARVPALFGGQLAWPLDAAPEVFRAWRSWTAGLPPEMTSSVFVVELPPLPEVPEPLRGRRVTAVTVCYAGSAAGGDSLLRPLSRAAAPLFSSCRPLAPADLAALSGAPATPLPEVPEPLRGRRVTAVTVCYAGSAAGGDSLLRPLTRAAAPLFSSCRPLAPADLAALSGAPATPLPARMSSGLLADLPDAAIGELLGHVGQGTGSPLMLAEIRHLGGAFAAQPPGRHGAIGQTGALYQLELVGFPATSEADEEIRAHQRAVAAALAPWTTGTMLPSFAPPPADAARVFPEATRRRLAGVKRRYDPGDVLRTSFPC